MIRDTMKPIKDGGGLNFRQVWEFQLEGQKQVGKIPFTPSHTLHSYHPTKITRFPAGSRLAKLRNTSKYRGRIEVGCQKSHCETMGAEENLNIWQKEKRKALSECANIKNILLSINKDAAEENNIIKAYSTILARAITPVW